MTTALVDRVRSRLVAQRADATPGLVAAALRAEGLVLGDDAVLSLVRELRDDLVGAGPLEPLLRDADVTDILVNGASDVWVDRGRGLERSGIRFPGETDVQRLAQRLAAQVGRRLDQASPFVDARLPSGARLHCVLPPIAVAGTTISLRVPRRLAFSIDDLIHCGTLDEQGATVLRTIVAARLGFLISGGTGTGKTTVLSTMLGLVPGDERIVIVEDSTELMPCHPHAVSLQSRLPNLEGAGTVTLRDLVRQALRMRPDRVVVGEVRGAEVVDLLTAMNTGHEGGCGTLHANSAEDVPARLEALGLMAGLDRLAVHALVSAGVDAVVHLDRPGGSTRRLASVHVLERGAEGLVRCIPALVRAGNRLTRGRGFDRLAQRLGAPQ
ncbi:MAG: TadA family conjugal transfer-associated ATPase [Actinomycetota bacterium]|nr:TadA family conjugal transfer-associated ATPase [Actinomycetota bacterium]